MSKSTEKSTEATIPVGALIPQPHGGAIRNGGTSIGGTGRPPSELRAALRGSFANRIAVLESIADSTTAADKDRIRAVDVLAKYGLGTVKELTVEHIRDRLSEQIRAINAAFSPDEAEKILAVIEPVWRSR